MPNLPPLVEEVIEPTTTGTNDHLECNDHKTQTCGCTGVSGLWRFEKIRTPCEVLSPISTLLREDILDKWVLEDHLIVVGRTWVVSNPTRKGNTGKVGGGKVVVETERDTY